MKKIVKIIIILLSVATCVLLFTTKSEEIKISTKPINENNAELVLPTDIVFEQTSATIYIGEDYQISATVKPANATNKTITYSIVNNCSSEGNIIASVTKSGVVHGISKGQVKVIAKTSNGKQKECTINVDNKVAKIESIMQITSIGHGTVDANGKYSYSSYKNGWGDAVMVYGKKVGNIEGERVLMDTFISEGWPELESYIDKALRSQTTGIARFNLYLSHRHNDHFDNWKKLFDYKVVDKKTGITKKNNIEKLYLPDLLTLPNGQKTRFNEMKKYVERYYPQTKIILLKKGSRFYIGPLKATVIWGPEDVKDSNGKYILGANGSYLINNESLVTKIETPQGASFLTAGDIESELEKELVDIAKKNTTEGKNMKKALKADIFKANHHGLSTGSVNAKGEVISGNPANTKNFINLVNPSFYFYTHLYYTVDSKTNARIFDVKYKNFGYNKSGQEITDEKTVIANLSSKSNGFCTGYNGQIDFYVDNTNEIRPKAEKNTKRYIMSVKDINGEIIKYNVCNDSKHRVIETARMKSAIANRPKNIEAGDTNENNIIDVGDILMLLRYIAYQNSSSTKNKHPQWNLNATKKTRGDLNKNGTVDIGDVLKLKRYIAAKNSSKVAAKHPGWMNL